MTTAPTPLWIEAKRLEYEAAFILALGIPPDAVDRMTVAQFLRCCDYCDQIDEARSANAGKR